MKAILEFDLPEDQEECIVAVKSKNMWIALWDMSNNIRTWCETSDTIQTDKVSETFYKNLENNDITLEELS